MKEQSSTSAVPKPSVVGRVEKVPVRLCRTCRFWEAPALGCPIVIGIEGSDNVHLTPPDFGCTRWEAEGEEAQKGLVSIPEWAQFQASLSPHPVVSDHGILRYEARPLIRWLGNHVDLNAMWAAYGRGTFSCDEFMQFYRDIGYSLAGFEETWGEELEKMGGEATDVRDE